MKYGKILIGQLLSCRACNFDDKNDSNRGKIAFVGSLLFTHFDEIGDPVYTGDAPGDNTFNMTEHRAEVPA